MNPAKSTPFPILLTTKLNTPRLKADLVPRQALLNRLNEGLLHDTKLFLISAPAGYGKTTLVCEWLNESTSHTWLSLDEKDNDPVRFLTYLIASFRKISPDVGQATQSLFSLPQIHPVDVLITPLINELSGIGERLVLILDDYHLIHNRYIHDIIRFLLDYRPPFMHLALVTREDPPLALAALRAKGDITEIRANELRFSEEETAAFMTRTMKLNLGNQVITLLNMMTEGWIVGLQLAAISMQGYTPEEIDGFLLDFSGSNQYIIDYLVSEVLAKLSMEFRDFLKQTAVLDRLCAPLCNAVTGRVDSQSILEFLKRSNLFLFPLDDHRRWYRYHCMFADSLRMELSQEEKQSIHQKAAQWYEDNGFLEEAVEQTIAAADYQETARLICLVGDETFVNGRLTNLKSWLESLPDDLICTYGELTVYKLFILYFRGQIEAVEPYITTFESKASSNTNVLTRSRFCMIHAALFNSRDDPRGLELAKEALDLGKDSVLDHIADLNTYGLALCSTGNLSEAINVFREAFGMKQKLGCTFLVMYSLYLLLSSLELNGRLGEAIRLGENILTEMTDHSGILPLAKIVYLPLGISYYKANNLEKAIQYLSDGIDIYRKLSLLNGEHKLAQVYAALGDSQKALITISEAMQEIDPVVQPLAAFDNTALEAEILLRQGKFQTAIDWAKHWQLNPTDKPTQSKEQSYFTFIRLLLAKECIREAINLLEYLEDSTRSGQRYSRLITVHILQALAYNLYGNDSKSLEYLKQALILAAPEGYYQVFLNEGPVLAKLLKRVNDCTPGFVDRLLVKFDASGKTSFPASNDNLLEPLTRRELEVLCLVATGLSNHQIAEKLLIATSTVRKHLENAFGKLNVQNRTQAVARARELHLL